MDIVDFVNEPPQSNRINSVDAYLAECNEVRPIDRYFEGSRLLLRYGTESRIAENAAIGKLLLLGLVSEAESFYRSILAACLEICPVCQKAAGEKSINLGGVLWHGQDGFSRSAFEHMSFSSKEELKKGAQQFLDFQLEDRIFRGPLSEFEKICQLRHGIVHNAGFLPGRNAVQLGIRKYSRPVEIIVGVTELQEAAAVIETLVVTLNREFFGVMCKRWAVDWRSMSDWDDKNEAKIFNRIWRKFLSEKEWAGRRGKTNINARNCMVEVKNYYNI